ncbi:MAG: putative DNA binding domain-containing protein [Gammaproteobacteria bacterium]|nr:putative DNA binding domain-containing protein [Gammaproteobacteria bacterium]
MNYSLFDAASIREDIDTEAKRATGRDGRGALPESIWETYSAFANTEGGIIFLGVEERDDGTFHAVGIAEPDRVLNDLWAQLCNPQKASHNLLTDASVRCYVTDTGRWVLEIEVPRATRKLRPVFINGNPLKGTYKRLHSGDFRCREEDVRRMLAEQSEDSRDARILVRYRLADLNLDSLNAYRNRLASFKPDHPYLSADTLGFLRMIGGWRKDRSSDEEGLTLAGLLMFGEHQAIQEALPYYFLDYREMPASDSKTEWIDRVTLDGTWSGGLYDFYRLVIQRLYRDLQVPFYLQGDKRDDDTPVHKALREALVNALVHADYSASLPMLITKAPAYFEFRNPGRMRITVNEALAGGHSDCRNRLLQKMFSLIGLGEQAGSGIPRVMENWKLQHYRPPELLDSVEPEYTLMRLRMVSLLPSGVIDALRQRFGIEFDKLNEHERLTLSTALIEGYVINARVQQVTGLHPRDITTLLRNLVRSHLLVSDGRGRGSSYRISGEVLLDLDSSTHLELRSTHLPGRSTHLDMTSTHLPVESDPSDDAMLIMFADEVRGKGKASNEAIRRTLLALCRGRFLTPQQLGKLLLRTPHGLRERFIKPMLEERLLERRFPQLPNHEQQAYRARESDSE